MNAKKSAVGLKSNQLEAVRNQVDLCLQTRLEDVRFDFTTSSAHRLVDELARVTMRRGSRFRPLLCCAGYAAGSGEGGLLDQRIVNVAAGLEMLHTFALLHDDVMDAAPSRRGEPAMHLRLAVEHRRSGVRGDHSLFGTSMAILAGDLALVISDAMLAESGFGAPELQAISGPLAQMRLDAIAGQYLDISLSGRGVFDPSVTSRIARLKTGSYSVEGPLVVGATLAGASPRARDALRAFAGPLGEAFQFTDDILGLYGDPQSTGKSADNDLRQGKPTSLMSRALTLVPPDAKGAILQIWGNQDATESQLARLREMVAESGAVQSLIRSINVLVDESKAALDDPQAHDLDPQACELILRAARSLVGRATRLQRR